VCNGCNFHELLGREICGQRFAYFGGLDALVCGKYYRAASHVYVKSYFQIGST